MSESQAETWNMQEKMYTQYLLMKYDMFNTNLERELEFHQEISEAIPLKIGEHIYYRRTDNPADNLTLYRFPVDELERFEIEYGEMPYLKEPMDLSNDEEMWKYKQLEKEFPEEVVFSLNDIVTWYQQNSLQNETIKDFVEKVKNFVELQEHDPFHFFQINTIDNYCVIIFDTERNGKAYDIMIKDLETGQLMPTLIVNALDEVAFDGDLGIYYT